MLGLGKLILVLASPLILCLIAVIADLIVSFIISVFPGFSNKSDESITRMTKWWKTDLEEKTDKEEK